MAALHSEGNFIFGLNIASPRYIERLEDRKLFAVYYVSPAGNDGATGLSVADAWQTLERVNAHGLKAGDMILLQGGKRFSGHVYISSKEAGRPARPVIFSSYGSGRATILSGENSGLEISETAGVAVTNLVFVGGGTKGENDRSGIYVHAGMSNRVLSSLHIRNVDVSNYGHEGFTLIASGAGSSISDVKIERSSFHDNGWGGVNVTGNSGNLNANKNYLIQYVRAYNNRGIARSDGFVTGNGIYVADIDTALVQRCLSWNNGAGGVAPVGIWAAGSNNVTFQYNESYSNKTASGTDGGGFDFDWNVTNSVMQYNYLHDNDGPGYMLGGGPTRNSGNVVRYNISQNDGRKNGKGAIYIWGNVTDAAIYNNTIFLSATSDSGNAAIRATEAGAGGKIPQNISVRNNIFYTTGGAKLINLTNGIALKSRFAFTGNAWFSGGGAFGIQWGGTNFASVTAWRTATGQEMSRGLSTGYQGDPRLIAPGTAGTVGDADKLAAALLPYRLQKRSPLIDRGRPYPFISGTIPAAATDFFGELLPVSGRPDIGADEVR
ncbi:MAG: hypothetical protein QOF78_3868 [Phycisphaerales bacterium]|nr:hypothetical protein [Phycisphaerales bacterium]